MEDEATAAEASKATSENNSAVEAAVSPESGADNSVPPTVEDANIPAAVSTPGEATGATSEETSIPADDAAANLPIEGDANMDADGEHVPVVPREPTEESIPVIISIKSMHESDSLFNVISSAISSENSQIPLNIAEFDHSFGYDSKRHHNLCLIDLETLVFAAGNFIHFLNINTREITIRRTCRGGGIGSITKNPNPEYNYLTVAENGDNPPIFIYEFPSMKIIRILRDGTRKAYSKVDYSPNGELFCSQGGEPDYTITVWNWKRGEVILQSKAFINDVWNVTFSPSLPGHITSSGLGHIKFWKMCQTFTGLKLEGELGKFGKTEICDVLGIYPLPDEKVISSSDWGNMLVWEEGQIKFEVCQRGRKTCHKGPITQIFMKTEAQEVITIGVDGYVRIWSWEPVELADPPDTDRFVEIPPMLEFHIGEPGFPSQLICMVKELPAETECKWYVQDGKRGIWMCELSPGASGDKTPSTNLLKSHSGGVVALATSPTSEHFVTLGEGGGLHLYNYLTRKLVIQHTFPARGGDLIWLPITLDPTGVVIIVALSDGVIRMVKVDLDGGAQPVQLLQVLKPHIAPINKITINDKETLFVTGSQDNTIFIHSIIMGSEHVVLRPIGMVKVEAAPTAFCWNPKKPTTLLIGCLYGEVYECDLPEQERSYTDISYDLYRVEPRKMKFKSTKSQIRRDEYLAEVAKRKEKKREKKMEELKLIKKENPGFAIDEERFLKDSEDEEVFEPLYFPKIPNRVLCLQYTPDETVWLSMGGYDAGYVYEYSFGKTEPISCTIIPNGDDIEIHSFLYCNDFLIFGMGDGSVRVNKINPNNFRDLSDYWIYHAHDNRHGAISALQFSFNYKYLFSVGMDGCIFSYEWNGYNKKIRAILREPFQNVQIVPDIVDAKFLSLEQQKAKDDYDRRMAIANNRKNAVLAVIKTHQLEFDKLMQRNEELLPSQKIPLSEFELDPRITADLEKQFENEMALLKRKAAYDVEKAKLGVEKLKSFYLKPLETFPIEVPGLRNGVVLRTFKIGRITEEYLALKEDLEERKRRAKKRRVIVDDTATPEEEEDFELRRLESFLYGLTASTIEFRLPLKMRRLLNKYRTRKAKEMQRKLEWIKVEKQKPDPNKNHPDDDKAMEEAERALGANKMKRDPDYNPPEHLRETTFKKYTELFDLHEKMYEEQNSFNEKVLALRAEKVALKNTLAVKEIELAEVHLEIPKHKRRFPPFEIKIDIDQEYPERKFDADIIQNGSKEDENLIVTKMEEMTPRQLAFIEAIGVKEEIRLSNLHKRRITIEGTDWEEEIRERRKMLKMYEQDGILKKMAHLVLNFDKKVRDLADQRNEISLRVKFMENYKIVLNQELQILKDFEQLEEDMLDQIDSCVEKKNDLLQEKREAKSDLYYFTKNINTLKDNEKRIGREFVNNCQEGYFKDFLRKVFRKKYRPPKIRTGSHLTDSSSSSSSEDATSSSDGLELDDFDLGNVGTQYLDQNVCPVGLPQQIWDLTIDLRTQRYRNEKKTLENFENINAMNMKIAELDVQEYQINLQLEAAKDKHRKLCRQKQLKLNDIDTLGYLSMHQMQYFRNLQDFADIEFTLLFNNESIHSIYAQVGILARETMEIERKHRINVLHVGKMKTDIKFMENQIIELKRECVEVVYRKFGRMLTLDDLEETVLRRMCYEMRADIKDIKKAYAIQVSEVHNTCSKKKELLIKLIQQGIEKVQISTVLVEQNRKISHILNRQDKLLSKLSEPTPESEFEKDIIMMRRISGIQQDRITTLEKELNERGQCPKKSRQNILELKPRYNVDMKILQDDVCDSYKRKHEESVLIDISDGLNDYLAKVFKSKPGQITEEHFHKLVNFLSRYFATLLPYLTLKNYAEFVPHIKDNLESFLPPTVTKGMTCELIGNLLLGVLFVYNPRLKEEMEANREVIEEVIEEVDENKIAVEHIKHIVDDMFDDLYIL